MLRIIECFKNTGMSISEMQQYVEMVKRGDESLEETLSTLCEKKRDCIRRNATIRKTTRNN